MGGMGDAGRDWEGLGLEGDGRRGKAENGETLLGGRTKEYRNGTK